MIVALRQEIFMSNMTQRPMEPVLDRCNIDESFQPTSDAGWTYRIIAHTAKVTNFAYGDARERNLENWDALWRYLHDWDREKPESFKPAFYSTAPPSTRDCESLGVSPQKSEDRRSVFPKILYVYDCPAGAEQYAQLSKILLLAHNPRSQHVGLGKTLSQKNREDEICNRLRIIVGIAKTNSEYLVTQMNAGMVVSLCGELFSDPTETRELLDLISRAQKHLQWPDLNVKSKLQEFWNL